MNYVDFAIAASIFLIFFTLILIFTSNYFGNLSTLTKTYEYRDVAVNYFNQFFSKKGTPSNWETRPGTTPVELGLAEDIYKIPVLIKETAGLSRSNEQITVRLTFDEDCEKNFWNNTLRIYDEDNNETVYELSDVTYCSEQYIQVGNVSWELNSSANEKIRYIIYYSGNRNISGPEYSGLLSTSSSFMPADRDSWTEATGNWSRYGGNSGTVTLDSVNKVKGSYSVNVTGTFNSSMLGLQYNPSENITSVNNNWYINGWIFVDDTTGINEAKIALSDFNESISINLGNNLTSNTWKEFSIELSSNGGWTGWSTFNAANGIDYVIFYLTNSSSGLTRTLKIDNLYFSKKPLNIKVFPKEEITGISYSKLQALRNLSTDEIEKIVGEGYKVRIEVRKSK
jgi:hypothetical protein